jgi:shikimate dehydrogenase
MHVIWTPNLSSRPGITHLMKVVLIGEAIGYSASPAMQEAGFRACGLDWTYELVSVPLSGLAGAIEAVRGPDCAGANVTIPHKVAVLSLLDALDGEATATGAVNTVHKAEGRLIGSNTDVAGIRSAMAEAEVDPTGAAAVVLGGGGSARAVASALRDAQITFVLRDPKPGVADAAWRRLARRADVVVNATPLGRNGELPLAAEELNPQGAVIDLVYAEGMTPLIRVAKAAGIRCAGGWTVLLAQGAAAFEAWTGRPAPIQAMRAALPI